MTNNSSHRKIERAFAMTLAVVAMALFLFSAICTPYDVAYATSPQSYLESVSDKGLDWYMSEKYLDLPRLKALINGVITDFDALSEPIIIAVIDSGINAEHEIFCGENDVLLRDDEGNIIGANTVLAKNKEYAEGDIADDAPDYHGTHVAGIIATFIHELNLENYIKIMPIKAAYPKGKSSSFSVDALKDAITFALDNGADVVNMSLTDDKGVPSLLYPQSNYDVVTADMAESAIFVSASGNDGNGRLKYYPAASENVIGVMGCAESTSGKLQIAGSSNYGDCYDLVAYGSSIYSADGSSNNAYKKLSGTSMATPMVSFASALATLIDRARCLKENCKPSSPEEIADVVKSAYVQTVEKSGKSYKLLDMCSLMKSNATVEICVEEGLLEQVLGSVAEVKLSLKTHPEYFNGKGEVEWTVNDGENVENYDGFELSVTPQNALGGLKISARWTYEEGDSAYDIQAEPIEIEVSYLVLDVPQIRATELYIFDKNGLKIGAEACKIGETYTLTLDGISLENLSPDTTIEWYVAGAYVKTGDVLEFCPEKDGEYVINAKINGTYAQGVAIVIRSENACGLSALEIASITIACLVVAIVLVLLTTSAVKRRRKS